MVDMLAMAWVPYMIFDVELVVTYQTTLLCLLYGPFFQVLFPKNTTTTFLLCDAVSWSRE